MTKLINRWEGFIRWTEGLQITVWSWVIAIGVFMALRIVGEGFSQKLPSILAPERWSFFVHAFFYYIAAFLGMALLLAFTTREPLARTARFALVLASLIITPPILDLIVSAGRGGVILYRVLPPLGGVGDALRSFVDFVLWSPYGLLFLGDAHRQIAQLDVNYGVRLEVLAEILLVTWYVFTKTRSAFRLIGSLVLLYVGLFFLATLPSFVSWWSGFSVEFLVYGNLSMLQSGFRGDYFAAVLIPIVVIQALLALFIWHKEKALALLRNIRPLRLLLNLAIFSAGLVLGLSSLPTTASWSFFDSLIVVLGYISVTTYWLWAVAINDQADVVGDRVSMSDRPLPRGVISRDELAQFGLVAMIISWSSALLVSWGVFVMIVVRSSFSWLYSLPPFRLKRVPILSNFVIGGAYLSTAIAGYLLVGKNGITDFPGRLALAIIWVYTFAVEFKNIKDISGDRADGIRTIPVILGDERSRLVIGLMGVAAFLGFPLFYPASATVLLPAALSAGTLYYYAVNRRPYRESIVFGAIFLFIGLLALLWIKKLFVP